jgi:hypothetical protein
MNDETPLPRENPLAISKIEIALIVVLTVLGLGIWLAAAGLIDAGLGIVRRTDASIRADAKVPQHEAELAEAQSRLEANRSQVDELRLQNEALAAEQERGRQIYPQLTTITDTLVSDMPVEALQAYFAARERAGTAQQAGTQLTSEIAALVAEAQQLSDTLGLARLAPLEREQVTAQRAALQEAIAQAQQSYAEHRIAAAEESVQLAALNADYPDLHMIPQLDHVPAQVLLRYLERGAQREGRLRTINRLRTAEAALGLDVAERTESLAEANDLADKAIERRGIVLGSLRLLALVVIAGGLLIAIRAWLKGLDTTARPDAQEIEFPINSRFAFMVTSGLLAILLAYQFSLALALILIGAGLLRVLLIVLRPPAEQRTQQPQAAAPQAAAQEPSHEHLS